MKKSTLLTLLLFASTILYAQRTSTASIANSLPRIEGGIFLLIGAVLAIFLSLAVFLLRTDYKIRQAEKQQEQNITQLAPTELIAADLIPSADLIQEDVELHEAAFVTELDSVT